MSHVDTVRPRDAAACRLISTRQQLFRRDTERQAVVCDSVVQSERVTAINRRDVQPLKLKRHHHHHRIVSTYKKTRTAAITRFGDSDAVVKRTHTVFQKVGKNNKTKFNF